jgi:hypothetical protein
MKPPRESPKLLCALCVLCEKRIEIGIGNLELPHGGNALESRRIAHRKLLRASAPLRDKTAVRIGVCVFRAPCAFCVNGSEDLVAARLPCALCFLCVLRGGKSEPCLPPRHAPSQRQLRRRSRPGRHPSFPLERNQPIPPQETRHRGWPPPPSCSYPPPKANPLPAPWRSIPITKPPSKSSPSRSRHNPPVPTASPSPSRPSGPPDASIAHDLGL